MRKFAAGDKSTLTLRIFKFMLDMHTFNATTLREALRRLPIEAQSAFAQACAIRTLETARGEFPEAVMALCRRSLDAAKRANEGERESLERCADLCAKLEDVELDDERISTCAYVLRHLIASGDAQEVVWAAQCAYEWQDQIAQDSLEFNTYIPEVEARLMASSGVQEELRKQHADIEGLLAAPAHWHAVIERAKRGRSDV